MPFAPRNSGERTRFLFSADSPSRPARRRNDGTGAARLSSGESVMSKRSAVKASPGSSAKDAAARGRSIQANIDRLDAAKKKAKSEDAMQAGQRQYPSKFPP